MLKNNLLTTITSVVFIALLSGCTTKNETPSPSEPSIEYRVLMKEREEKKIYDPMLKDNAPTQRAVVDMGVVLKTHIVAYKDNSHNLIAGHDVFFWAVKPDFITTNALPKEKRQYSYQGPIVEINDAKFIDTDRKVDSESRKLEKEQAFDQKIDAFLKTEANKEVK